MFASTPPAADETCASSSRSKNSFATINAFTASRAPPPQAAIADRQRLRVFRVLTLLWARRCAGGAPQQMNNLIPVSFSVYCDRDTEQHDLRQALYLGLQPEGGRSPSLRVR